MHAWRAVAAPAPGGDAGVLADKLARYGEHQHDGMFGNSDGIGAAIVGDGHTGTLGGGDVGLVVTGAEQLDEFQLGGDAE